MQSTQPLTYAQTGVDIDRGDAFVEQIAPLAKSTRRNGSLDALGGFGGLFDLKAVGMTDPVLVAATDGVGSKLDIALDLNKFDSIGIDLVAMCVNDLICQNAQPLFFLDYLAVNRLDPEQGVELITGITDGCLQSGAQLIGGETAEMPSLYPVGKFDLAGFAVGAVERDAVLPRRDIQAGDRVIGIHSAGLHSNGYSLINAVLRQAGLGLGDDLPGTSHNIGGLMLEPTRIYVKAALTAAHAVKAYAHITGGGLIGNVVRVLPKGLGLDLDASVVPAPDLARFAINHGHVTAAEAYRVWNMGIGFVAIVADDGDKIGEVFEAFSAFECFDLGVVTADSKTQLRDNKFDL